MDIIRSNTKLIQHILREFITDSSVAVDCTLGNGNDSLWLLEFGVKKLYSFDIQKSAILSSKNLLEKTAPDKLDKITFILDSHKNLNKYVKEADIIVFNLGYLPGGDKSISTTKDSSLVAISAALATLNKGGICTITVYDGHEKGAEEKSALLEYVKELDSSAFHVAYVNLLNQHKNPPEVIFITKK